MAKSYRLTPAQRAANAVFRTMTRLGIGAEYRQILTVRGRKTGELRSTPVDVMDIAGDKWLVAPYCTSNWVRNVRASGEVSLTRSQHTARYRAEEVTGTGAVPVLRTYIRKVRVTRPYFDATADSSDGELLAEIPRHPVFRLTRES
jgi:deazaflavin-dependent oxidoreductase (nitroreductase family)